MHNSEVAQLLARNPITGDTIFHELAEAGSVPLLNRIRSIIEGPYDSVINELNFRGVTCLHVAASVHRGAHAIQVMELLVEMGANINASDNLSGATVLHDAVWYEDQELATWLCQQPHINLDARRWDGVTAYQMAFMEQNKRMTKILHDNGADCEAPPEPTSTPSKTSH